jgi:hypothetical protein
MVDMRRAGTRLAVARRPHYHTINRKLLSNNYAKSVINLLHCIQDYYCIIDDLLA